MQQPPSLPFHLASLPHPHTMAAHHDHLHQQQQQQPPLDYQPGNTMSRKCGISSSSDSCPRPSRSMSPSPSPAATTAQAAFFRRSSSSGSLLIGRRFERDPGSREDLTLARVLASCTPKSMQGQAQSAPFLDSAIVAGVPKRQFYAAFEMSEDILDEDNMDENPQQGEKKCRRLTVEQVRALEKAFDSENKLEPERKIQLASQLGLQARQVAVWFQNRRARWKTKQMEKDYGILKKKFDSLKADRDSLLKEKEGLQAKVMQLKANGKNEEALESEPIEEALIDPTSFPEVSSITTIRRCEKPIMNATPELKENDGSSSTDDSDGSVIVNVHSPWPIEKNLSAKLPNTIDPGKPATQVADSSLLDEGDYYLERAISVAEQIYMRPIKREESCYEEESGSPFVPWEWWELS